MSDPLYKRYEFTNFEEAYSFVQSLAKVFEEQNHHPDVKFGWGYVEIWSISHDAGGVTERDHNIMNRIAKVYEAR